MANNEVNEAYGVVPRPSYPMTSQSFLKTKLERYGVGPDAEGIAKTLTDIFQKFAQDERLNYAAIQRAIGPGKTEAILVAAANSPSRWKDIADYICPGSGDFATINDALEFADMDKRVVFAPGTFVLGGTVTPPTGEGAILIGNGWGGTGGESTIFQGGTVSFPDGYVEITGIEFDGTNITFSTCDFNFRGCHVDGGTSNFQGSNIGSIVGCLLEPSSLTLDAINVTHTTIFTATRIRNRTTLDECYVDSILNTSDVAGGAFISNSVIDGNLAFDAVSSFYRIHHCLINGNVTLAGSWGIIESCWVDGATGITFPAASADNKAIGNHLTTAGADIILTSGATRPWVVLNDFETGGIVNDGGAVNPYIRLNGDSLPATMVSIADAGGYYTGTDVEAALQEIGASLGAGVGLTYDDVMTQIFMGA